MTGGEMQRAIEFLLEHQAPLEQRIEQTNVQLAETNRQLAAYAQTQSKFIEIATHSIQALTDAQLRTEQIVSRLTTAQLHTEQSVSRLATAQLRTEESVSRLATRQGETDARLDRLTVLVERFVSGGRNGQE
jgi:hypothetical protein